MKNKLNNKYIGTSFKKDLNEKLKNDEEFKILFEKERFLRNIAENLSSLRKNKGLTQSEVADKSQMKQSAIARLESLKNTRLPSLEMLNKIANTLDKKIVLSFQNL